MHVTYLVFYTNEQYSYYINKQTLQSKQNRKRNSKTKGNGKLELTLGLT